MVGAGCGRGVTDFDERVNEQTVLGVVHQLLKVIVGLRAVNLDNGCSEYRTVINAFIGNEVNHHPSPGASSRRRFVPGSLNSPGASEFTGQCGMKIQNLFWEPTEEAHREQSHPSREHHEVRAESSHNVGQTRVEIGPSLILLAANMDGGHARLGGSFESEHVGLVGDDGHHLCIEIAALAGVEYCLEVRAATRHKYHQPSRLVG